jgi:mono/diheme cytochrome c family protein
MRHILANIFTYSLIVGLVLLSCFFAWVRSEQLVVTRSANDAPREPREISRLADFDWYAFGQRTYLANCQNCHTSDGSGRGMYPPVQQMAAHLEAPGGRGYLIDLNLYGLFTGTYGAPMPSMPELSDAEIAAVTNYLLTQFAADGRQPDPSTLYLPGEVAERRGRKLSERQVAGLRPPIASARELGRGVYPPEGTDRSAVPEGKDE